MEIIHFVQYSVLKKKKTCVTISTTKKRLNSKAKCKTPKAEKSNLCRLIKESKKDLKMKNHKDVKT